MKKSWLGFFAIVCSCLVMAPLNGEAADKKPSFTLRFGHALTEQDIYTVHMREWAEAVSKATNGDILIEIYPSSQLGSEEDVLEQIRQGANVGWQTDFARLGSYVNGLSVVNAPFFVDNLEEAFKLQGSATIKKLNEELAQKFGIAHISFNWIQGQRHVFANKIAKNPTEMKGMLIRSAPAPIWAESVNAMGCKATPLPYGEIYTGIQSKVVDGCELPYNAAKNLKLSEVVSYVMETGHIFQLNAMVVSEAWLKKLPADYQKILIDECNKAGERATHALAQQTDSSKQALIEGGIKVIPRSELDIAAFKASSIQAYNILGLTAFRDQVYADIGKK
ncbi:MAG: C4-dicarboxylate TRAP transporter substrate-binding protein [Candidatus Accumulibacter sp.]|jgi:TRAP-type C4-dicarboxylate transport system substrate-binding protein|nr:C4-dicarboxylate TRAP transporter substrate-binding protein [Accumulibacter sp.]